MANHKPYENHPKKLIRNSTAEFLIFTGQAGEQSIEARYEDETIWLTQKLMAELFAVDVRTVSEHLKNIFQSSELIEDSVVRKFRNTATMRDHSLFPVEITQYDAWVIRELLHNCIAHQDYALRWRINVVEDEDSLLFVNVGKILDENYTRLLMTNTDLSLFDVIALDKEKVSMILFEIDGYLSIGDVKEKSYVNIFFRQYLGITGA